MTHEEFREKLRKSAEEAHRELFEQYCSYVYTIVFNRLRSCAGREDVEECVCDVFSDVYLFYDTEKKIEGDVKGFIGTVARRKSAVIYKKRSSLVGTLSVDDDELQHISSGQNIEQDSDIKERRRIILQKISELGEPDSTIIIQKYYYGRSANEISEMVSLTPENIRVRCGRAVKKLKELLITAGISL